MGRCSSRGRRSTTATIVAAKMRTQHFREYFILFCGFAECPHFAIFLQNGSPENFHLDIVIQFVAAVAIAEKADITGLYAFGIYQLTFGCLDIVHIFTGAQARGIVVVIIKYGFYVFGKIRVISNADNRIEVDSCLFMIG